MAVPNFDKGLKTSGPGYLARLRKPEPHFMVRWPWGGAKVTAPPSAIRPCEEGTGEGLPTLTRGLRQGGCLRGRVRRTTARSKLLYILSIPPRMPQMALAPPFFFSRARIMRRRVNFRPQYGLNLSEGCEIILVL